MDGNKLEILRVRIKVSLPGQKWTNRTVVMTGAGELVAVLPENAHTESMTLTEDVDPELGW